MANRAIFLWYRVWNSFLLFNICFGTVINMDRHNLRVNHLFTYKYPRGIFFIKNGFCLVNYKEQLGFMLFAPLKTTSCQFWWLLIQHGLVWRSWLIMKFISAILLFLYIYFYLIEEIKRDVLWHFRVETTFSNKIVSNECAIYSQTI